MSKAELKKIDVKVALAEKYERLASVAGSKPKHRHGCFTPTISETRSKRCGINLESSDFPRHSASTTTESKHDNRKPRQSQAGLFHFTSASRSENSISEPALCKRCSLNQEFGSRTIAILSLRTIQWRFGARIHPHEGQFP